MGFLKQKEDLESHSQDKNMHDPSVSPSSLRERLATIITSEGQSMGSE